MSQRLLANKTVAKYLPELQKDVWEIPTEADLLLLGERNLRRLKTELRREERVHKERLCAIDSVITKLRENDLESIAAAKKNLVPFYALRATTVTSAINELRAEKKTLTERDTITKLYFECIKRVEDSPELEHTKKAALLPHWRTTESYNIGTSIVFLALTATSSRQFFGRGKIIKITGEQTENNAYSASIVFQTPESNMICTIPLHSPYYLTQEEYRYIKHHPEFKEIWLSFACAMQATHEESGKVKLTLSKAFNH